MRTILLLALAAAVYPQLLAVVVLILTRPNPKPLLWACFLSGLLVSVGAGVAIFVIFRSRGSIAGATSSRLSPATYLVVGGLAVALAILLASKRGRALMGRDFPILRKLKRRQPKRPTPASRMKSSAERALAEGSVVVAGVVGALLAVPGPFDLLAVGHVARDGYGVIAAAGAMFAFALIKFVLIEVPIASYAIDPGGTAAKVSRFSEWMQANKLAVVAATVCLVGVVVITRGVSGIR
jgi:hypothetical protein